MTTPTPEAIEAAARASFERDNSEPWAEAAPSIKDEFYADATAALATAYPLMEAQARAEALREAVGYLERIHPAGLTPKYAVIADLRVVEDRMSRGLHANGNRPDVTS